MVRTLDARWSALLLVSVLSLFYLLAPIIVNQYFPDKYWIDLSFMSLVAIFAIMIAFYLPLFDRQIASDGHKFQIKSVYFHGTIWFVFLIVMTAIFATADHIPIVSAFQDATAQELSEQRAAFLKTRSGWEALLNYANASLISVIVPFSLAALFLHKQKLRWIALFVFIIYCQSSLEKALYLKALLPLCYLAITGRLWNWRAAIAIIVAICALLYINTMLAGGTDRVQITIPVEVIELTEEQNSSEPSNSALPSFDFRTNEIERYFKAQYKPASTMDQLLWRLIAVPVFTAGDSLKVFETEFENRPLYGATSSLLSSLFGLPRVPFEAMVHGYQFSGGELSPTGRANSAYFIEAFINFGWLGVIGFSLFIGQSLRWFWKTKDAAFESVWPLYVMNLFQSGLIGNLLSNAFSLLFVVALFVKIDYSSQNKPVATLPRNLAQA